MKNISSILEGKTTFHDNTISEELTVDNMARMKFAPINTVDVERSFSRFKTTFADNRRSCFNLKIVHIHLIVQCYNETQGKNITNTFI